VVLVGEGLGGAVVSGYGGSVLGANTLTVSNSTFTQNAAQGGDNNSGTASAAGLVGSGTGAGIANYAGGTAIISGSVLDHNQAIGGRHNSAGGTGAVFANLGAGGAIFNYLGNYISPDIDFGPLIPSVVTVSDCLIDLNTAQGGSGGNGEGGGIANLVSATTTVTGSILILNEANGTDGGAGLGGGAYNDADSTLTLTNSLVTLNRARGARGIGGGIYTVGTFTLDAQTVIFFNQASTSGNNIGP
jgi:fibronectin-binding autotransporter adhesin